ncbi:MAG TPA: hypothetical protein VNN72_23360 [Polyangiaceae bacterium]|nr:hypothetical protein [Polyangiaceae bacterium]
MSSLGRTLSSATFLASVVACNALLDNPERHLAASAGTGGSGARAGMGGTSNGMGGNGAGAGGRGAGSGGMDAAGEAAVGGSSARAGTAGDDSVGGSNVGGNSATGGSTGGSAVAGEAGASDGSGGSAAQGGTGGSTAQGGTGGTGGMGGSSTTKDSMGVPLAAPGEAKTGLGEFLNLGDMRLVNDRTGSWAQGCEATTSVFTNADRTVGWDFNRGNCVGDGDPDFLGIEFGIHPFAQDSTLTSAPDYSSTTLMPVQLKNIQSASVTVDSLRIMLNEQAPNFLLGFRVWLSLHDPKTNPSPAVSDELVVLWGWAGRLACGQTATIVSGGKSYDLCQDDSAYGWQGVTWRYREFRLQSGPVTSFSGAFDIKALLNWIIATDPAYSTDHWVTRFEIGTELGDSTSGSANVKDVTFELNGDSRSITLAE